MEKFAAAFRQELANSKGIELSEAEVISALEEADKKTEPSVFGSMDASHSILDMVGVPRQYADGDEASLDARLAALVRQIQAGSGGGCSSGGCSGCG